MSFAALKIVKLVSYPLLCYVFQNLLSRCRKWVLVFWRKLP